MDVWNLRGKPLKYFNEDEIRKIHRSSLELLERTGCVLKDEEALEIFEEAGAKVDHKTGRVRMPPDLVEKTIGKAPSSVLLASRDERFDLRLEENRVYFGTGSVALNVLNLRTGKVQRAVKKMSMIFARLVDHLAYIHFYKIIVHPSDVPPRNSRPAICVEAAFQGTVKHFSVNAYSPEGARESLKIGRSDRRRRIRES